MSNIRASAARILTDSRRFLLPWSRATKARPGQSGTKPPNWWNSREKLSTLCQPKCGLSMDYSGDKTTGIAPGNLEKRSYDTSLSVRSNSPGHKRNRRPYLGNRLRGDEQLDGN